MINSAVTVCFTITGLIWLYIIIQLGIMMLNREKFFTIKTPIRRLHLKHIKRLIEDAPSAEAKNKLTQFKKVYVVFLSFFYLSMLLFVVDIIIQNQK